MAAGRDACSKAAKRVAHTAVKRVLAAARANDEMQLEQRRAETKAAKIAGRAARHAAATEQKTVKEEAARLRDKAAELEEAELEAEGVSCAGSTLQKLELRCMLSFQRLVVPAKGSCCTHMSRCNYSHLRDYVGRCASGPKLCPIAGCQARVQRTRDVERDDILRGMVVRCPRQPWKVRFDGRRASRGAEVSFY